MNIDPQLEMFQAQGDWLRGEKSRLLFIIRTSGAKKHRAWIQLLELAQRIAQFNREFTKFMETHKR